MQATDPAHVLGDWGTSRLRLYLAAGTALLDRCEGPGIGALAGPPADVLHAALAPWLAQHRIERVALCGMAGSRNGLIEVPYLKVPVSAADWLRRQQHLTVHGLDVSIAPGLCAVDDAGAPDVMRGEECQIFGAMLDDAKLRVGRRLIVLPGTHSKWVHLQEGSIAAFTSYITGELFALLRQHSTLLRAGEAGEDGDGFAAGLSRSLRGAGGLLAAAFEARSAQLVDGRSRQWAEEFLSGLLIGTETRAALDGESGRRPVILIGDPRLTSRYRIALAKFGVDAAERSGDQCAIAGLELAAGARKDART